MKNKRMIVVDLDGTALNSSHQISRTTSEYLKKLKDGGYIVVIATGRILRSGIEVTEGAEFANYVIASGGGIIYDNMNHNIIFKSIIPKEKVEIILSLYKDDMEYIEVCDVNYYHKYTKKDYKNSQFCIVTQNRKEYLDSMKEIIHTSIIPNYGIDELLESLKKNLPNLTYVKMQDSFSDRIWIDIFEKDISKYNTIKLVAEKENIENEDIIAFGDGRNDINMIQNCGVGVAMNNALWEVKEVADYITKSNDEDGIIYFLQKYLNKNI